MDNLLERGRFLLENTAAAMNPYPYTIIFVTTPMDWDAVVTAMHANDPAANIIKHKGQFTTRRDYQYVIYRDEHWYIAGANMRSLPYNHYHTGAMLGIAMDLGHEIIIDISNRIGNDATAAPAITAIMHDWFMVNWREAVCVTHENYLAFIPDDDYLYLSNNKKILRQVIRAQEQLGSPLALTSALQRECQRLMNTQVMIEPTGWNATTYYSGGEV
ncbi:hypothetical protein RAY_224 [Erwinia phage vB_EamM_RAY]|jgi:hypothetical protein|uniref:Uncharacterized protein n=3 Tax=Agricanvirus TaxID=1984776 RepID=A0A173GE79_9CAUD|nr:hypothetical protein Ea357_221 [Erwinia phage Ea35-70]YP_009605690.1 hypothetical protein FDH98_gp294 [Erwinia phage vB_EamM_RAY]AHI60374.1 hypothetical protein Ea357_221 [Erwinia phage Ea35-70]ANH52004.1 hypothetical protein RAY_224 [Erwinia phage vB_EamM_RAY]AUG86654.1 hypothetical protein MADMEL_226 [Erwinia phage vB_EamM_MadMel]